MSCLEHACSEIEKGAGKRYLAAGEGGEDGERSLRVGGGANLWEADLRGGVREAKEAEREVKFAG